MDEDLWDHIVRASVAILLAVGCIAMALAMVIGIVMLVGFFLA